jgi:NTP pyrophosphatase (non-canonical NTP hydrolase)
MEMNELQKNLLDMVNRIDKKEGVNHNDELTLMHLTEEFGEVSREIINPKLKRGDINIKNLQEEIADVIILISKLANNHNINIEEAIKNKMIQLKERHNL